MSEPRDDQWLDALAGRAPADLSDEARREIEALREAMRETDGRFPASADETERELERLLFRMRKEGLLETKSRWSSPKFALPLAAAAVLVLGVSIIVFSPHDIVPEETRTRGGAQVQVIEVPQVDTTVAAIAQALREQGVEPNIFPRGIYRTVDASIPAEKRDVLRGRLKELGVVVPADGELHLEIREAPPR